MLQKEIEFKLTQYHDPYLDNFLPEKAIKQITISDKVEIHLEFGYPALRLKSK